MNTFYAIDILSITAEKHALYTKYVQQYMSRRPVIGKLIYH